MSVVGDIVGGVFQRSAANKAADAQREASSEEIAFAKESRDVAREDLAPFREAGVDALEGLSGLVTDPNQQKQFIEKNPFFDALSRRATETVMQNAAAQGRSGSGGTAEALQKSLVLLGSDLLNQNISQRQNLAGLGQASAAGQAQATQQASQQVGSAMQDIGNASAAGQIARGDANARFAQQAGQLGETLIGLCDYHAKENIKKVGRLNNGLALYQFNYKGDKNIHVNVMAQDVEQVFPEYVVIKDGLKYVNMEVLCH